MTDDQKAKLLLQYPDIDLDLVEQRLKEKGLSYEEADIHYETMRLSFANVDKIAEARCLVIE